MMPSPLFDASSSDADPSESSSSHRPYRKPWTVEEDEAVRAAVASYGVRQWPLVAACCPGRTGKQCRERWHNHLDTAVKKEPWSVREERMLIELQAKFGNQWAVLAKYMQGRTDNAIKNHFNSVLRRGESIGHLREPDGSLPSAFPGGVVPEAPPSWQVTASSSSALVGGAAVTPPRHPRRPTQQEADKINSLLKVEPMSSLAAAVGFPVSSTMALQNTSAQPALTALLAVIRARDKHELFSATAALQQAVRAFLPLKKAASSLEAGTPPRMSVLTVLDGSSAECRKRRSSSSSSSSSSSEGDADEADALALAAAVVSMSSDQQRQLTLDLGTHAPGLSALGSARSDCHRSEALGSAREPLSARDELERCADVSPLRPGPQKKAARKSFAAATSELRFVTSGPALVQVPLPTSREPEPLPALMPSLLSPASLLHGPLSPRCGSAGPVSGRSAGSFLFPPYSPAAC